MAISKNSLAMAAVFCVTAGISMPVAAQEPNCKEPQTQADMTICAGKDYEKADKQLNVEYQKLRKLLTERDKAADADGKLMDKVLRHACVPGSNTQQSPEQIHQPTDQS